MLLPLLFLSLVSTVRSSSALRFRPVCGVAERQVQMPEGAAFKIGLFADLHFGEDAWTEWGPRQDLNSINVMNSVLQHENPGDVTFTAFTLHLTHSLAWLLTVLEMTTGGCQFHCLHFIFHHCQLILKHLLILNSKNKILSK